MHVLPRNGQSGMLRGRRVAGIFAFALALALGLMLQATDPAAAAPPPQTPDDADRLSHDTEEILVEPEASGNTVGYANPSFADYTSVDTLGSVDRTTFDAFGVTYTIVELTQTGDELTISITPCPETWEIETLTLGEPSLGTGRSGDLVIEDSASEAQYLTLESSTCVNPNTWVVSGVPTNAMQRGHGSIGTKFRVRSLTTQRAGVGDDIGGFSTGGGLKRTICALPDLFLGEGSCAPLMIFTPPLVVVASLFGVAGVRNPMILAGAGLVAMSAMSALVLPSPVMILGFVVASVGTTAMLLLLRR